MKVQQLIKDTCAIVSEDLGKEKAVRLHRQLKRNSKRFVQKTHQIPKSSALILTSAFTLVLLYTKFYA